MIYLICYAAIIVFAAAIVYRIMDYVKKPLHVRWELYPVAHEAEKAEYGGGYLEETDWWKKPRKKSLIGELKVMIPEILLLKAVWEHNRSLWYLTYPFHLGLYLIAGFIGLLSIGAVSNILNISIWMPIAALTNLLGPVGFVLCIYGACALFYRRLKDPVLRNYSSYEHFFNLGLFAVTMVVAILTWLFVDPNFNMARAFTVNLITFNFGSMSSSLFNLQVVMGFIVMAYIPLTHMSHFFMKYFLYHDIRWGDEPTIDNPATDAKIGIVLNYPIKWSASHIAGHGKNTWAEVATFNPAQEPPTAKE
ncbi:MAG: respiratory nitrate reductase subunit gamma [Desulfobacterales bacterium]|nr:respiratory nitrate reductase subunit gamma [Desulfobacterales bacterium]